MTGNIPKMYAGSYTITVEQKNGIIETSVCDDGDINDMDKTGNRIIVEGLSDYGVSRLAYYLEWATNKSRIDRVNITRDTMLEFLRHSIN